VIATLRSDFWHRALEIPELAALAEGHGRVDLLAASAAELIEIVRKPAQAAGLMFEVHAQTGLGLDAVLAQDAAATPGALPLLSFTLDELYRNAKARGEDVLTHESYEVLGGLEGAIANRADEIVSGLPAAAQAALPRLLRELTTVSEPSDRVPVARAVPLENFAEGSAARILIDAFIAARLLVAGSDPNGTPTVRLANEALISRWQRARYQFAQDREFLAWRNDLETARHAWEAAPDRWKNEALLMGFALVTARAWLAKCADDILPTDREFISASIRRSHGAIARVWRTIIGTPEYLLERPSPRPLGTKVFISYRRADTRHVAGRVYDLLEKSISEAEIFIDVDTIPIGVNFKEYITDKAKESAVMLVIIGERWLNSDWRSLFILKSKEDFVQSEIELALDLGVPIIPLLVDGVPMPRGDKLPKSISELVLRNAATIRSGRDFQKDMVDVLKRISAFREQGKTSEHSTA
jgi:hypothetical protein